MIERNPKIEAARFVEGDLGVHFVYTAGVAGEEFVRGLEKGTLIASTCDRCSSTYLPPRIFCEECFAEVTDRHEVQPRGTLHSVTRLAADVEGRPTPPHWVGAVQIDGTDSTLLHRLAGDSFRIGDRVEGVWASKRTGSILDLAHFRAESAPGRRARDGQSTAKTNGRAKVPRRAPAVVRARGRR